MSFLVLAGKRYVKNLLSVCFLYSQNGGSFIIFNHASIEQTDMFMCITSISGMSLVFKL